MEYFYKRASYEIVLFTFIVLCMGVSEV